MARAELQRGHRTSMHEISRELSVLKDPCQPHSGQVQSSEFLFKL